MNADHVLARTFVLLWVARTSEVGRRKEENKKKKKTWVLMRAIHAKPKVEVVKQLELEQASALDHRIRLRTHFFP